MTSMLINLDLPPVIMSGEGRAQRQEYNFISYLYKRFYIIQIPRMKQRRRFKLNQHVNFSRKQNK